MARLGAPPKFDKAQIDVFLDRVERGEKIMEICADPAMPSWPTVQRWRRTRPAFAAQYARTREASAEALEHSAIMESWTADDINSATAARLRVDTLKWAAAKRDPRRYADKMLHTGADGEGPIEHRLDLDYKLLSDTELAEFRRLLEKAMSKKIAASGPLVIEGEAEEVEE